jgi:hypothetical protein
MKSGVLALMCFSGATVFFALSVALQRMRMRERRPTTPSSPTLAESRKRNRISSWVCITAGSTLLAAAILLELHGLAT